MCASSDPGPSSDLIRGQLSVHAGFDGKVISGAHVIRLVARLTEMIGRHASNGRDKLRWVRSNRDLDGRLKVVYSQRHAVAFHNYRPCLFYLYSSFILLLPASFTVILSEVIAPRHQQRPSSLIAAIVPPKTSRIAALWYLSAEHAPKGSTTPAMDIVLEVVDTFIFDPLYAKLLPGVTPSPFGANATYLSYKAEPTSFTVPHATWQYEPSTHHFSLQPSQYAYMSAWARDDWRRQAITLFLITWYAPPLACLPTPANSHVAGYSVYLYTSFSPDCPTSSSSTRRPSTTRDTSRIRSSSR
jgi:hypothetical protein